MSETAFDPFETFEATQHKVAVKGEAQAMASDPRPWFQPKRFGYGAGLPITWEGWAVLILFLIGIIVACVMLTGLWQVVAVATLVVTVIGVAATKTEGGWRWRWGNDR